MHIINLNTAILLAIVRTHIFQQSIPNKTFKFLEGDYSNTDVLDTIKIFYTVNLGSMITALPWVTSRTERLLVRDMVL